MVGTHMNATTQSLSTDTALEVLAAHRRRQVLHHLVDSDGTATIDHLVEHDTRTETIQSPPSDLIEEFRQICSSN